MATYIKSLVRRASLTESSAKAVKAYKAKVASLSSEKVELLAWIQNLIEDVVKHKSDLKHISTAKVRAEDREKEIREGLRVAKDELRVVKEKLQAAREELCTKAAALDQAHWEASKAKSSVEHLTEECNALRGDFQRQEAMVSQRDGLIAELRDEPAPYGPLDGLLFNAELPRFFWVWTSIFKFLIKKRRKNPFMRTSQILGCTLIPPAPFLFPVNLRFLLRLALPSRLLGLRLLTCTSWRLAQLRLLVTLPQIFRPLCIIFTHFG